MMNNGYESHKRSGINCDIDNSDSDIDNSDSDIDNNV